jgi:hypothetical protein
VRIWRKKEELKLAEIKKHPVVSEKTGKIYMVVVDTDDSNYFNESSIGFSVFLQRYNWVRFFLLGKK